MIRIVIIEDYEYLRQSLVDILEEIDDFQVTSTYSNCEDAIKQFSNDDEPDVILMDISLPGMNGIEGTREIKKLLPNIKVLIITVHENSKMVFDALCAGALGYLTKNTVSKNLIKSIIELTDGGSPMSANIARMVVESFQFIRPSELTNREADVLQMLVQGKSYSSIAESLFVSINTVKYHIRNIYEKLHVNTRTQAIEEAKRRNIIK